MNEGMCVEKMPITDEYLEKMDAYWRAANYLAAAQLYLLDNPLLREPLKKEHIKKKIVGHWGTVPGQNFVYCLAEHTLKEPMIFSCRILISFSSEIPSSAPSKRKSAPTPKICFSRYRFFMETPFSPYSISPINFAVTPSCSASSSLESPRSSRRFRIRAPIADLFNSLNSAIHIPPHSRGYSL